MESLLQIAIVDVRILDVFDILIVAYLMYRLYKVLRGSIAFNIFIGVVLLYMIYWIVEVLQMNLLSVLLGKFVGYGVLILIIIFQPELRKFLLALGHSTLKGRMNLINKWFLPVSQIDETKKSARIDILADVLTQMGKTKTGALIVFDSSSELDTYVSTGIQLNAKMSNQLLLNLFFKNSPLHDGAVIINSDQIIAASCILPVSKRTDLPANLGLRHRAAIGITENTTVSALVVSEETGKISIAHEGEIYHPTNNKELKKFLKKYL